MINKKKIIIKSTVITRKSSDLKQITRKAIAGMSEAELIERNSIGTYKQEDIDDNSEDKRVNKKKD